MDTADSWHSMRCLENGRLHHACETKHETIRRSARTRNRSGFVDLGNFRGMAGGTIVISSPYRYREPLRIKTLPGSACAFKYAGKLLRTKAPGDGNTDMFVAWQLGYVASVYLRHLSIRNFLRL